MFSEGVVHTVGQPKVLVSITDVPTGKVGGELRGGGREKCEEGGRMGRRQREEKLKDKCKPLWNSVYLLHVSDILSSTYHWIMFCGTPCWDAL